MLRIKKGDRVIVRAGKDKGKTGKVLKVLVSQNRAIVEGINLVKKHIRRRSEAETGGIREVPMPIHISNLSIFCPNCNRGVRFGVQVMEDKTKVRVCKRCQRPL